MIFELCLLTGLLAVASNPSPYYAALGLVGGVGAGCLLMAGSGVVFLSLALFLVYLGGMMVVFAYSAALVAEPYPEAWGSLGVMVYLGLYCVLLLVYGVFVGGESKVSLVTEVSEDVVSLDWLGVCGVYGSGGPILFLGGWSLLLTLFVALEVVRGHYSGVLRAVE